MTKREQEVLQLVTQGLSNKAIADKLEVEDFDVKKSEDLLALAASLFAGAADKTGTFIAFARLSECQIDGRRLPGAQVIDPDSLARVCPHIFLEAHH